MLHVVPDNLTPTYQNETVDFLAGDNQPDERYDADAPDLCSCCVLWFSIG